jgi:hypothetical protein
MFRLFWKTWRNNDILKEADNEANAKGTPKTILKKFVHRPLFGLTHAPLSEIV